MDASQLRRRVYKDRDLDQLARDTDASLRAVFARMPIVELAPTAETKTGFTWKGKPIYCKHLSGVLPSGGAASLITGVDKVLGTIGHASITANPAAVLTPTIFSDPTDAANAQIQPTVDSSGNLSLSEYGSLFEDATYALTIFYTRKDGGS